MAKAPPNKKRQREQAREAYRQAYEKRRAEKAGKPVKIAAFNPELYLQQVRMQSWATIHTVLYAAAVTVLCIILGRAAGAQTAGAFAGLLLIGSVFVYLLRVWDIDLRKLGRATSVVGVFLTYFVTWFAVCFLIANPPALDDAPPEFRCCRAFAYNATAENWTAVGGQVEWNGTAHQWMVFPAAPIGAEIRDPNGTARVQFGVYDNGVVHRVALDVIPPSGNVSTEEIPVRADGVYNHDFHNLAAGPYFLTIKASDSAGHEASHTFAFNVTLACCPP